MGVLAEKVVFSGNGCFGVFRGGLERGFGGFGGFMTRCWLRPGVGYDPVLVVTRCC